MDGWAMHGWFYSMMRDTMELPRGSRADFTEAAVDGLHTAKVLTQGQAPAAGI